MWLSVAGVPWQLAWGHKCAARAPTPMWHRKAPTRSRPCRLRHAKIRWDLSRSRSPTTRQARLQGTTGAGWRAARSWLSLGGGSGGGAGGTGAAAAPDASRTRLGGGRDGAGCIQGASVDGSGAPRMRVAPAAADPP